MEISEVIGQSFQSFGLEVAQESPWDESLGLFISNQVFLKQRKESRSVQVVYLKMFYWKLYYFRKKIATIFWRNENRGAYSICKKCQNTKQ